MSFFENIFNRERIKFHFPYSVNVYERREQIFKNLQKGILLEDNQVFIPWKTEYRSLDKYKQKQIDSGDRTVWYLGERKILNGLTCHMEILKWAYQPDRSTFDKFSDNLGYDEAGYERFLDRIDHLTQLLGNPQNKDLKKFGDFEIGAVEWILNKVQIRVVGVEIFSCRYSLHVGLIDNSHDRDLKKGIDKLKAKGWTDEELGK